MSELIKKQVTFGVLSPESEKRVRDAIFNDKLPENPTPVELTYIRELASPDSPIRELALTAFATVKGSFKEWDYALFRAQTNDHEMESVCSQRIIEVAETFDRLEPLILRATPEQQAIIFAKLEGLNMSYEDCRKALDEAHPPLSTWLYNLMAKLANIEQKLEIAQSLILPITPEMRDFKATIMSQLAIDTTLEIEVWRKAYTETHDLNTGLKELAWKKGRGSSPGQKAITTT